MSELSRFCNGSPRFARRGCAGLDRGKKPVEDFGRKLQLPNLMCPPVMSSRHIAAYRGIALHFSLGWHRVMVLGCSWQVFVQWLPCLNFWVLRALCAAAPTAGWLRDSTSDREILWQNRFGLLWFQVCVLLSRWLFVIETAPRAWYNNFPWLVSPVLGPGDVAVCKTVACTVFSASGGKPLIVVFWCYLRILLKSLELAFVV